MIVCESALGQMLLLAQDCQRVHNISLYLSSLFLHLISVFPFHLLLFNTSVFPNLAWMFQSPLPVNYVLEGRCSIEYNYLRCIKCWLPVDSRGH